MLFNSILPPTETWLDLLVLMSFNNYRLYYWSDWTVFDSLLFSSSMKYIYFSRTVTCFFINSISTLRVFCCVYSSFSRCLTLWLSCMIIRSLSIFLERQQGRLEASSNVPMEVERAMEESAVSTGWDRPVLNISIRSSTVSKGTFDDGIHYS